MFNMKVHGIMEILPVLLALFIYVNVCSGSGANFTPAQTDDEGSRSENNGMMHEILSNSTGIMAKRYIVITEKNANGPTIKEKDIKKEHILLVLKGFLDDRNNSSLADYVVLLNYPGMIPVRQFDSPMIYFSAVAIIVLLIIMLFLITFVKLMRPVSNSSTTNMHTSLPLPTYF